MELILSEIEPRPSPKLQHVGLYDKILLYDKRCMVGSYDIICRNDHEIN